MNRVRLLQCVVLVTVTVIAYLQVRHHQFVWDTIPFVLENPWIHEWSVENLVAMFTQAHRANWHPVVLLSHAVDFSLFGDDSGKHHLVNLLLHTVNVLLVYWLVDSILGISGQQRHQSAWVAFLTAAIFGLHPQHVESVAWVVERKDVLYSVFALASLGSYLWVRTSRTNSLNGIKPWWHLVPFSLFCLSIGAKPMAVTLPVVMLMLDIYPLRRARLSDLRTLVTLLMEKAHYLAVAMLVALVTLQTQSGAMADLTALPPWARLVNAMDNTWFYIAHYIWPVNLSPFYPYPEDIAYLKSAAFWLPGLLFLVLSTTCVLVLLARGYTWPMLLLGFYLLTLLPVSGLIHVGPAKATDHYVYLATLPLSLLTAMLIVHLWVRFRQVRALVLPLSLAYFIFLFLITQTQVSVWNNPLSLWLRVTAIYPDSPFGHRNLAAVYVQMGDWQRALEHGELSLRLGSPDRAYVEALRLEAARQLNTDN